MKTEADARSTATFLQGEACARRIDPITEIWACMGDVNVTVCPTDIKVWNTWISLFKVDPATVKWGRSMVDAVGEWYGVRINLRGLDTDRWHR